VAFLDPVSVKTMHDFSTYDTQALLDLLADYTEQFTKLFIEKNDSDNLEKLREEIVEIQLELQKRKSNNEGDEEETLKIIIS
jgi:hypothetical protein